MVKLLSVWPILAETETRSTSAASQKIALGNSAKTLGNLDRFEKFFFQIEKENDFFVNFFVTIGGSTGL